MRNKESKSVSPEIAPDMKSYLHEMFNVLQYQGYTLSLAGMNMGRSSIDMVRDLLITSVERIGKLDCDNSEDIWQKKDYELYEGVKSKIETGEIIPGSKLTDEYRELFQDIRTLYFLAMEKVKEKGNNLFSYEGTSIGVPVELTIEMLDKIVDSNLAKAKWEEIKKDKNRISDFYTLTKWRVDDLL